MEKKKNVPNHQPVMIFDYQRLKNWLENFNGHLVMNVSCQIIIKG